MGKWKISVTSGHRKAALVSPSTTTVHSVSHSATTFSLTTDSQRELSNEELQVVVEQMLPTSDQGFRQSSPNQKNSH